MIRAPSPHYRINPAATQVPSTPDRHHLVVPNRAWVPRPARERGTQVYGDSAADYALVGILPASFSEMVVTVSSAAVSCFRFSPSRLAASVSPSAFAIVIRPVYAAIS